LEPSRAGTSPPRGATGRRNRIQAADAVAIQIVQQTSQQIIERMRHIPCHAHATCDVLVVRREDPVQPDVVELLRPGEAHSATLYPAASNHHLPLDGLRNPGVHLFVARDDNEIALATGAVVIQEGCAEIKRMWVEQSARGRGIADRVLETLIATARRGRQSASSRDGRRQSCSPGVV